MKHPDDNHPIDDDEYLDAIDVDQDFTEDFAGDIDAGDLDETDVTDIDQNDDAGEGIFAPEKKSRKAIRNSRKKTSSKVLLGGVAVLAVLGGAIFYFLNGDDAPPVMAQMSVSAVAPPARTPALPPYADTSAVPALPVPKSDFVEDVPAAEQSAPSLASVDNPTGPDIAATEDTPIQDNLPTVHDKPKPNIDDVALEQSAPLSEIEEAPKPALSAGNIASRQALARNATIAQPEAKPTVDRPSEENVQQAMSPETGQPSVDIEKARINAAPAPKKEQPLVYFDAPKGKILKDLPPPSINLNAEPGQSVIIVKKEKPDVSGAVQKGSATSELENTIASANRAMALERYDAALNFYNEAYRKNPRDPRILMGRAVALQKSGETQLAIDAYSQVLEVSPENAEAITNLMGLTGKTQPAVALQNLLELRSKYPNNPDVAAQLGVAYAQAGNSEDALRYLQIASSIDPKNPQHYFNMAVLAERAGKRDLAIQLYEKALDTDSIYGSGRAIPRDSIYDRLSALRG